MKLKFLLEKMTLKNSIAYVIGNLRYKLWYSNYKWLIRRHIQEQIDFRILFMKKECWLNGSCTLCGCSTTALQMADKSCDSPCYPEMMNKGDWEDFKRGSYHQDIHGTWAYRNNRVAKALSLYNDKGNYKSIQATDKSELCGTKQENI